MHRPPAPATLMPGIFVAAAITAGVATAFWGAAILLRATAGPRHLLILCFLLQLPVSVLAYHAVRIPLDHAIHAVLGDSILYQWGRLLYAPLTEEPAKLWPLIIPWIATRVRRENAAHVAAALGLGFGVGEIGLIADIIHRSPSSAGVPWFAYGGFAVERFMVCLVHGLLTSMALFGWKCWSMRLAGGLAIGMALHFSLNFPIAIARVGWLGTHPAVASTLLLLWIVAFFMAAVVVLLIIDARVAGKAPPDRPVT
jgi:hypothetical protein